MGKRLFSYLGRGAKTVTAWPECKLHEIALASFDQRYGCYRLATPEVEPTLVVSLRQFGQLTPVVCCIRDETPCLIDGYKRLAAARRIREIRSLSTRVIEADDRQAKAVMYRLNQAAGRRIHVLEEAWIIYSLVREDGLSQLEAAQLLGRHKSWVCRRLALLEKLAPEARRDLQLGLVSPTAARQLLRLPRGNQLELLECVRREELTAAETRGATELLLAASTREQKQFVLEKPRQALSQARGLPVRSWDPRLSTAGNEVSRRLSSLLDGLGRMENWLRHQGRAKLSLCDCGLLAPGIERLSRDARVVGELAGDMASEMNL
jgi:ParB-like chromosome segregation protein Spo0J